MKRSIPLLLLAISLFTCKKEEPQPRYKGVASAIKNGQPWSAYSGAGQTSTVGSRSGSCAAFNTLEIGIGTYSKEGFRREDMLFNKIPTGPGTYPLQQFQPCWVDSLPGVWYTTVTDDGDVVGDVYKVVESENNFVTVAGVDQRTKEITGTFQVTLAVARYPKTHPSVPDTLRFTEGSFRAKIMQ